MDSSSTDARGRPLARIGALGAAVVLLAIGIGAVVKGVDGRSTVHDTLAREQIVGLPYFTPAAIAGQARKAGLRGMTLPTCSVAGKPIDDGASARCFAQYMRIDALMATKGATYSQMPRFASADGKGTNDPAAAVKRPDGQPLANSARNVWVTETALSTALNTSYMAEQISLFGIAVGAALLLVGLALAAFGLGGVRVRRPARAQVPQARTATMLSRT
jgi:hypothetical protein